MPNLCSNNLTIAGDPSEIARFVKAVTVTSINEETKQEETDIRILKSLYPCPAELYEVDANFTEKPDMIAKYGVSDWYEWCNRYWGTKWGDYDHNGCDHNDGDSIASFRFNSAWSPPIEGMTKVSEQFPELSFLLSYEEGGMCFLGASLIIDGVLVHDVEGTYPDMDDFSADDDDYDYDKHYEKVCENIANCEQEVLSLLPESHEKYGSQLVKTTV